MTQLIDQFPSAGLTRPEEARLAKRIAAGDVDAQNTLVMSVMRQALPYTRRTCGGKIPEDERVSLCYNRLMRAAKRFDPSRGLSFFAFAKMGLRGLMKTYWEDLGTVRNAEQIVSISSLEDHSAQHIGRASSPFGDNGADQVTCVCREQITGEITEPDFDSIFSRDEWADILKRAGHKLSSQHRMVLSLIYKGGLTGPEIGKLIGCSRSRVHAIHKEALKIIRNTLSPSGRLLSR